MDFITAEEKTMLEEKLSELRVHDKALIQRIAEARALGDLPGGAQGLPAQPHLVSRRLGLWRDGYGS